MIQRDKKQIDEAQLLVEYRANIELWKHDDMLRQERDKKFLNINTWLIVALGIMFQINKSNSTYGSFAFGISLIAFSIFGIVICYIWDKVLSRNSDYIRFRKMQLREIEAHLKMLGTFHNSKLALDQGETITFEKNNEAFTIDRKDDKGTLSSTATEGRLPVIVAVIWIGILIVGVFISIGK